MIKTIFRLAVIVLLAVLGYNYFFGNETEKENAQKIVQEFKDVAVSVKDLFVSEKEKIDEGKYSNVLDRISALFENMKNKAEEIDPDLLSELKNLEEKRDRLQMEFQEDMDKAAQEEDNQKSFTPEEEKQRAKYKEKIDEIVQETEALLEKLSTKSKSNE